MRREVKEVAGEAGARTALVNAWLCGDRPYNFALYGHAWPENDPPHAEIQFIQAHQTASHQQRR
jgi:hypothetical protein